VSHSSAALRALQISFVPISLMLQQSPCPVGEQPRAAEASFAAAAWSGIARGSTGAPVAVEPGGAVEDNRRRVHAWTLRDQGGRLSALRGR
jgi:hypothetical protein